MPFRFPPHLLQIVNKSVVPRANFFFFFNYKMDASIEMSKEELGWNQE